MLHTYGDGLIWVTEQPEFEPTETKTETSAHRGMSSKSE
jgi:hypothetical protein